MEKFCSSDTMGYTEGPYQIICICLCLTLLVCAVHDTSTMTSRNIFDHQAKTFSRFCCCSPSCIWSCLGLHGEHQHLGPNKRPSRQDWVSQVSLAPPLHWLLLLVHNLIVILNEAIHFTWLMILCHILILNHFKTPSQQFIHFLTFIYQG